MKTVNAVKNVVSALSVGKYWVRLCYTGRGRGVTP